METEVLKTGYGRIHVAGYPISNSVSPCFHRFILKSLAMPWTVSLLETVDCVDLKGVMQAPDFVGAAVSLPLKTAVLPLLDRLDDDAKTLGAVNTIFVRREDGRKVFVGANTDWKGMTACILSGIGPSRGRGADSDGVGMVIGGGVLSRTATYALVAGLGLKTVYLVQCEPVDKETAEKIWVDAENGVDLVLVRVDSIEQAQDHLPSPRIIINAVRTPLPHDPKYQQGQQVGKHFISNCQIQPTAGDNGGGDTRILLDMASFRSRDTDLTVAAKGAGWKVASFVDFMAHQATQQSVLWTGANVDCLPSIETSVAVLTDALCGPETHPS